MAKTHALVSATGFLILWLAVLYAGADHPPPRGFLWIVLLVFVCSLVVYWRVPAYVAWAHTRRPGRLLRAALDGLIAGVTVALVAALMAALIPGGGEASVTPSAADRAVWFGVLAAVGAANSVAVYAANALAVRVAGRRFPRE